MLTELLKRAVKAKSSAGRLSLDEKNSALKAIAQGLINDSAAILAANESDMAKARGVLPKILLDRLSLTQARLADMAHSIETMIPLGDPVGRTLSEYDHPNGLIIRKISVPMGVIAMIYESRPNVTADAAALCIKSGNVCILRGGKEAYESNMAIVASIRRALTQCDIAADMVSYVNDTTRQSAIELMSARGYVDLLIPRGGAGLIRACVDNAKVPIIETGTGINHIYIDKSADIAKGLNILLNAKLSRPSVCNAAEVCLVHKDVATVFLKALASTMAEHGVEMRICERCAKIIGGEAACAIDYDTEFLDKILAVRIVDSVQEAIEHIARHSTHHSDAIITQDGEVANMFCRSVDSAAVYINASTRFTDGGEFGFGCEMGISTQKLGPRGPMGLSELTSYKYIILGRGQIRE